MCQQAPKHFVDLLHHTAESNKRNTLLFDFRFETVIPLEVGLPTIWTKAYDASHNEEVLARDLDIADERRENSFIWMVDYQKQLAKTYN